MHRAWTQVNQDKGVEGWVGFRRRAHAAPFLDAFLHRIMSNKAACCFCLTLFCVFSGLGSTLEAQTTSTSAGSAVQVTIPTSITQDGFTGGVPSGKLSSEPLQISFLDAIDRGLRQNLGLLLSSDSALSLPVATSGKSSAICCRTSMSRARKTSNKQVWRRWGFVFQVFLG